MGLINRLKRAIGSDSETEPNTYRCRQCDHTFESTRRNVSDVTCGRCGGYDVQPTAD